jgi:hypothetical protein
VSDSESAATYGWDAPSQFDTFEEKRKAALLYWRTWAVMLILAIGVLPIFSLPFSGYVGDVATVFILGITYCVAQQILNHD